TSGTRMYRYSGLQNGHFQSTNTTMRQILENAWHLSSVQIDGPTWIDSDHYDIGAKSPEGVPDDKLEPMLQALLKERFHLDAHLEQKERPVYNLVVLKTGPKIKPFKTGDPITMMVPPRMAGGSGMMTATKNTMDQLAIGLADPTDRPVINKTGLAGPYTYVLQYGQIDHSDQPNGAPDIFGAVQQQLGLKLEPAKAIVPTLIVDHADRVPTGN
ncbi:MAG TPA: TIGR03435 family protein, partial [Bryobacteraceae bacterium]